MSSIDDLVDLLVEIELPLLEGFKLDHAEALAELGNLNVGDLDITQVSAARIAAQLGGYVIEMSGGQLTQVSSAEELLTAIDTAFANGSLTELRISDARIDLVQFNLTENGFVLRSGSQALYVTGAWPSSLEEISKLANLLTDAQSYADLEEDGRGALVSALNMLEMSEVVLRDGGQDVLIYQHEDGTTSVASSSTTVTVAEGRTETAKTFYLQISGLDTDPVSGSEKSSADLESIPYSLPEIIDELGLNYTKEEIDRLVLLRDHTYVNYSLEQSLSGPYVFELQITVDAYFKDSIPAFHEGSEAADTLVGTPADELFRGRAGDDIIDGAGGTDAARFSGLSGQYSVVITADQLEVRDRMNGRDGRDVLTNIEVLKFDDQSVDFGNLGWIEHVSRSDVISLTQLYIASLGRVPDVKGMLFWMEAIASGLSVKEIAMQFATQPEFAVRFPDGTSADEFVDAIYDNVLGRAAESEGKTFWVEVLTANVVDRGVFVAEFLGGVTVEDDGDNQPSYLADLTEIGIHYALDRGLSQTDTAYAIYNYYAQGDRELTQTIATVDLVFEEAKISSDALLISLPNLIPDFAI